MKVTVRKRKKGKAGAVAGGVVGGTVAGGVVLGAPVVAGGVTLGAGAIIGIIILGILSLLLTLCVVPVAGVAALGVGGYFLLKDDRTEELNINENFDIKAFGQNALLSSIDNTESTGKIQVVITKDDINNLLYQGVKLIDIQKLTSGYVKEEYLSIKKAYITIDGNDYHFYVDVNAPMLKTRVHLTTTLYEKASTNSFVFKIKDISFGNISGLKGITKKVLNQFVKEEMINEFIEKTGLSMKYNSNNLSITYAKEDVINDLSKMTGNNNGIYMDVVQAIIKKGLINFNLGSDNFIEGAIDLTKLHRTDYDSDDAGQIVVNHHDVVTLCRDKTMTLVNTKKVADTSSESLTSIFKYLFLGCDGSDDTIKSYIDGVDMSSIGIPDKTTYKGFDLTTDDNLLYVKMTNSINPTALMYGGTDICKLSETDISEYVRGRSIVGYTTLITRTDPETGETKISFVTIDNFYCNLYKDANNGNAATADFIAKINLNGYPTSLAFSALVPEDSLKNNSLTFKVKDIKYGEMGGDDLTNMLFEIIASALDGGDSSISANRENHTITFNFERIITQAREEVEAQVRTIPGKESWSGADVFTGDNIVLETFGDGKHDVGQFGIMLKNPVTI